MIAIAYIVPLVICWIFILLRVPKFKAEAKEYGYFEEMHRSRFNTLMLDSFMVSLIPVVNIGYIIVCLFEYVSEYIWKNVK